jgi:hypothetical protein
MHIQPYVSNTWAFRLHCLVLTVAIGCEVQDHTAILLLFGCFGGIRKSGWPDRLIFTPCQSKPMTEVLDLQVPDDVRSRSRRAGMFRILSSSPVIQDPGLCSHAPDSSIRNPAMCLVEQCMQSGTCAWWFLAHGGSYISAWWFLARWWFLDPEGAVCVCGQVDE